MPHSECNIVTHVLPVWCVRQCVCAWPWEFTGNTKGVSLPVSARLPPSHTRTPAHTITLSVWWAHVIGCRELGAHAECWWGSLGAFFRRKGDTGERFLCAFKAERKERREGERRSSSFIYQSQTLPLPPGEYRARVHIATPSHMEPSFLVQYSVSVTPSEDAAHKQADWPPPNAFSQTFVPTLPQILHLSRLMRWKISLRLTRETFRVSSMQSSFWCKKRLQIGHLYGTNFWKRTGMMMLYPGYQGKGYLKLIHFSLFCKYSSKPPHV